MRIDDIKRNAMIVTGKHIEGPYTKGISSNRVDQAKEGVKNNQGFREILKASIESTKDIKFSKHAARRMQERNIKLSNVQLYKMENALEKAQIKGAKDSLLLMGNTAFIVNVPSRTIVTAIDNVDTQDNVFTNIDSAIII